MRATLSRRQRSSVRGADSSLRKLRRGYIFHPSASLPSLPSPIRISSVRLSFPVPSLTLLLSRHATRALSSATYLIYPESCCPVGGGRGGGRETGETTCNGWNRFGKYRTVLSTFVRSCARLPRFSFRGCCELRFTTPSGAPVPDNAVDANGGSRPAVNRSRSDENLLRRTLRSSRCFSS